jgi:hypothetical protein
MKFLNLTVLSLFIFNYGIAQSTTATNVFVPGRFLGYTNAGDLDFFTNNQLIMRVNQTQSFTTAYLGAGGAYLNWLQTTQLMGWEQWVTDLMVFLV